MIDKHGRPGAIDHAPRSLEDGVFIRGWISARFRPYDARL